MEVTPHPARPSADGLVKARGAVHLLPSEKVGKLAGRARARAKPFPSPQGRGGTARRRGPHVLQVVGVSGHFPEVLMPHRKRSGGTSFQSGRDAARRAFDTPASREFMNCSSAQGGARPPYSTTHVVNPFPRRTSSSAGFVCRCARSQESDRRPTTTV